MSVTYLNKEYRAIEKNGLLTLDLSLNRIRDITEIKGLEELTELQALDLSGNQISEINGLDTLINLVELDLSSNRINEIRGLANLTNLRKLNLRNNLFINIEGLENLIHLKKVIFGFAHWEVDKIRLIYWSMGGAPKKTLLLNGSELTEIEKDIVKGGAKKLVAYCRVKVKQAGYAKRLVPADSKVEKYEKQILKMIKENEKKVQKAIRKAEIAKRQKFNYDSSQMRS